ncbi:MAG: hypothetical protein H7Y86_15115 [Rhizobacter sp.]|nr:hypothetical protein [Ferruginibacter sp.]
MKNTLLVIFVFIGFVSCKKDKFTTAPQISFVDITPGFVTSGLPVTAPPELIPKLIFKITDAEGDFGNDPSSPQDSSWIYIKHLLTMDLDSLRFPDLQRAPKNNFEAEVTASLFGSIDCIEPGPPKPRVDTVFYEIYVRDAKGNKSNVIKTSKPLLTECK